MTIHNPLLVLRSEALLRRAGSNIRNGLRGFTLIELLVVVTIIVALLAILLPSMSRAVKMATVAQCGSNLRQAGGALLGYHADAMRFPPIAGRHTANVQDNPINGTTLYRHDSANYDLRDYVEPYVRDLTVWNCPNSRMQLVNESYNAIAGKNYFYGSYAYFPGRKSPDFNITERAPEQLTEVRRRRPIMQDQVRDHTHMGMGIWNNHSDLGSPESIEDVDGANILYYDTSVRWATSHELQIVGTALVPNWSVLD